MEAGDGGIREKSKTFVKIESKITPQANIQKCLSYRPGRLSALIGLSFIMNRCRLFFRLCTIFALRIARKAQGIAIRDCHYLPDNSVEKIGKHS